jgi:hypothetical protein
MYVIMMISLVSRHYRIRLREYLNMSDGEVEQGVRKRVDQLMAIIRFSLEDTRGKVRS